MESTVGTQQFLIDLLCFNVVHYSSLFQYFFQATMVNTLADFLVYLFVTFFKTILLWLWLLLVEEGTAS